VTVVAGGRAPARPQLIRAMNEQLLLDHIRRSGKLSRADAMARWREWGRAMRFDDGKDYVFAAGMDGQIFMHAQRPQLEGTAGPSDADGRLIIPPLVDAVRSTGNAVRSYTFAKQQGGPPLPKLTTQTRKQARQL